MKAVRRHPGTLRQRPPTFLAPALLVIAALVVYENSFDGMLVFDDEPALAGNPYIRHISPLSDVVTAPPDTTLAGRPVASLSFALNFFLAPGDVRDELAAPPSDAPADAIARVRRNLWGYHAVNLLIHLLATLALFGVVRRTLYVAQGFSTAGASAKAVSPATSGPRDATLLALAVALLWTLHPLQTNAVTYLVQRVESLMALFYLLTVYGAIRAHEERHRRWWMALSIVACALGMATKESMVTAPIVVVLWDWTFADRRRWPFYAALASTWIIVLALVAGGPRVHSAGFGFAAWPWWRYLITQAAVVVHYLRLAIVPAPLVIDYEWTAPSSVASVLPQILLLVALIALTLWGVMRRSPAALAGAAFFLILAPTSSVLPIVTEVAAEHRMYLPLAAVASLVVIAARKTTSGVVFGALVAAAALACGTLTVARNRDFTSPERIWLDTVQKRPDNARAQTNYATDLLRRGQFKAAEDHLRMAVRVRADLPEAETALGVALAAQGSTNDAIAHLQRAIAINPAYAEAHRNLGEVYATQGKLDLAVAEYLRALDTLPDDLMLLNRAGWILATTPSETIRDGSRALDLASRAVGIADATDLASLDTQAAAFAELGRFDEAVRLMHVVIARAESSKQLEILPELRARLALYEQKRPFRSP